MSQPVTFGLINTFSNPDEGWQLWTQRYDAIVEYVMSRSEWRSEMADQFAVGHKRGYRA